METLERHQSNRRVIEDFTSRTLAAIPSDFGRLLYVGSLRDAPSGRYVHEGLEAIYPEGAVLEALAYCHKELFARILEMPLERQEWDLRACLAAMESEFWEIVARWRESEFYRVLVPSGVPCYLGDLFASDVRALLDILAKEHAMWRSAA